MVGDFSMDLLHTTGEPECATRCVQCGEVVDPVIQRNRKATARTDDNWKNE